MEFKFRKIDEKFCYIENYTQFFNDEDGMEGLCNILNNQHKEIQKLKKENEMLRKNNGVI